MKCPYCDKEMKNGFVGATGRGGICWTNEMVGYGAPRSADGFFSIGKVPYLSREDIPAYNCETCKFIFIDYSSLK